jgi:hypothetical protein
MRFRVADLVWTLLLVCGSPGDAAEVTFLLVLHRDREDREGHRERWKGVPVSMASGVCVRVIDPGSVRVMGLARVGSVWAPAAW